MPHPEVNQNTCDGTGACIQNFINVFEWDPGNPGKARVKAGKTCSDVDQALGCQPAVDICPQGAIYHVD